MFCRKCFRINLNKFAPSERSCAALRRCSRSCRTSSCHSGLCFGNFNVVSLLQHILKPMQRGRFFHAKFVLQNFMVSLGHTLLIQWTFQSFYAMDAFAVFSPLDTSVERNCHCTMVRAEVQIACGMCRSKAHHLAAHDEINASSEAASIFECPNVHVESMLEFCFMNGMCPA